MRIDARIRVRVGMVSDAEDGDALLLPPGVPAPDGHAVARLDPAPGHAAGCACCLPRNAAAQALGALFLQRARGEVPFFRQVLAVVGPGDAEGLAAALEADPLVSARFRLA